MRLTRWILVAGETVTWRLAPEAQSAPSGTFPGGPWQARGVELNSPLLTRGLRLALRERPPPGGVVTEPFALTSRVTQLEQAPGPAALRESGDDAEWAHALDELMGAFTEVADAAGLVPLSLGVEEHQVVSHLGPSETCPHDTFIDRLILVREAWALLGLSRGLQVGTRLITPAGTLGIGGHLYTRERP